MRKLNKISILIILILGLLIIYSFFSYFKLSHTIINYPNFIVHKGDSTYKVSEKLCQDKKVSNCLLLKLYVKLNKISSIKQGEYYFSGVSLVKFFQQLEKGPNVKYRKVTILPGWTKYDIANKLKHILKNGNLKISARFLYFITDKKFINKLKRKYSTLNEFGNIKSLEGFIYPDTYFFKSSDLISYLFPELLIKTAIENFSKKWILLKKECKNNKNCNPYNLSDYEILILASIIEKEEKNLNNKPYVADILIRRYKNNWFLGADWTLCYGMKVISKQCKNYLYYKYLQDKFNSYNTRAVKGLPPTPVGNPTIDSIKAVLYPVKNNYWFYLHDKTGQIHFAKTANEHFINKQKYLK